MSNSKQVVNSCYDCQQKLWTRLVNTGAMTVFLLHLVLCERELRGRLRHKLMEREEVGSGSECAFLDLCAVKLEMLHGPDEVLWS